ncbi:MAG: SprT family zinc-dependent metalloprotease [Pseudomonadota bacterium]
MDGGAWQDGIPADLVIRRSSRAKRLILRVSSVDGTVSVTVPKGVSERAALAFVRDRADWIAQHRSQLEGPAPVGLGSTLPIFGVPHTVVQGSGRAVRLGSGAIAVPEGRVGRRLGSFLKHLARDALADASDRYAVRLGRSYTSLALRDTRSRWGSCSSKGRLMYSWRLVMAPRDVLNYVAAHEVAHLAHMDHSPRFWAAVARIHGPYAAPRAWLRTQGTALHRFRFED